MDYQLTFDQYQQALERGEFPGLKCDTCHGVTFPPMVRCQACHGTDLKLTKMAGKGTIRSFTVIRVAPEGMSAPYVVAMVELEEGPWALGNLVGIDPDEADMSLMGKKVRLGSHVLKGDPSAEDALRVLSFTLTEE